MSTKQLILHPTNPKAVFDSLELLTGPLQAVGFLGESFNLFGEMGYHPGQNFFDFITFESSHNVVILESDGRNLKPSKVVDSRSICQIYVTEVDEIEDIIVSSITNLATCPNCQSEVEDWGEVVSEWYENRENAFWQCLGCQKKFRAYELNWHRTAGFARYSIKIEQIYPETAFPTSTLLNLLRDITGEEWTYMYYWL
jgi:hypothetical protein